MSLDDLSEDDQRSTVQLRDSIYTANGLPLCK